MKAKAMSVMLDYYNFFDRSRIFSTAVSSVLNTAREQ